MRHSKKTPLLTINLRNHKLNQKAYFVISAKTYGPLSLHHWISQVRSCLWHYCTFYLLLRNDRLLATWRFFICSNCSSNKETLLLIDCFSRIVKTNPTWRSCSRCRTWAWSTTTSTWVDLWGFKFFSKVSSRSQKLFFPQGQTSHWLVMGSSWNFLARGSSSYEGSEPSRAELGHFNFRAETELTIYTICMSKNNKF